MAKLILANNFFGTLQTAILDNDADMTLVDEPSAYSPTPISPGSDEYLVLTLFDKTVKDPTLEDMEIVYVTNAASGTNFYDGLLRGMEGTSAKNWPAGTAVEARLTKGMFDFMMTRVAMRDQGGPDAAPVDAVDLVVRRTDPTHGADGANSIAIGSETRASVLETIAIGYLAAAFAQGAVAIGKSSIVSASRAVAIGDSATASGTNSLALGAYTEASGDVSVAIGASATVTGVDYGLAILGRLANNAWDSIALLGEVTADSGVAIGSKARATYLADSGVSLGASAEVYGERGVVIGAGKVHTSPLSMTAPPSLIPVIIRGRGASDIVDGWSYDFNLKEVSSGVSRIEGSSGSIVTSSTEVIDFVGEYRGPLFLGPLWVGKAQMLIKGIRFVANEVTGVTTMPTIRIGGIPKKHRWQRNKAVSPGDITMPGRFFLNGHTYTCSVGGTTTDTSTRNGPGAFPTDGSGMTDNDVTWDDQGYVNDLVNDVLMSVTEGGFEEFTLGAGKNNLLDGVCISITDPGDGKVTGRFLIDYLLIEEAPTGSNRDPIEIVPKASSSYVFFRANETKQFYFYLSGHINSHLGLRAIEWPGETSASFGIGISDSPMVDINDPANYPATYSGAQVSTIDAYADLVYSASDEFYAVTVTELNGQSGWAQIIVQEW